MKTTNLGNLNDCHAVACLVPLFTKTPSGRERLLGRLLSTNHVTPGESKRGPEDTSLQVDGFGVLQPRKDISSVGSRSLFWGEGEDLDKIAGGSATLYRRGLLLSYRPPTGLAAARMEVRAFSVACVVAHPDHALLSNTSSHGPASID